MKKCENCEAYEISFGEEDTSKEQICSTCHQPMTTVNADGNAMDAAAKKFADTFTTPDAAVKAILG